MKGEVAMKNSQLDDLWNQALQDTDIKEDFGGPYTRYRYAQLVLQAAIDNLEWHGRDDDAIAQVKYLKDTM